MKHFSFNLTEKYTIALLDLFNDIEIQYRKSNNETEIITIPLQFRSKERAINLSDQETQEIIKGNTSIIPRASLILTDIQKAQDRSTNKYINSHEIEIDNQKRFTLNSMPYDWGFSLIILSRTITESAQVIEQIAPMFRPTYTLNINEIPILKEPTTVQLELLDTSIDIDDDHDDDNIRTIITTFNFTLRGNMYLPLTDTNIIEHVKLYINNWFLDETNEYEKSVLISQDGEYKTKVIEPVKTLDLRPVTKTDDISMLPVITDLIIETDENNISIGDKFNIRPVFKDKDNTGDEFAFVWSTNLGILTNGKYITEYTATSSGTSTINLIIVDYHGNQSSLFSKDIIIN